MAWNPGSAVRADRDVPIAVGPDGRALRPPARSVPRQRDPRSPPASPRAP
jgi:hypothetical protein